VLDSQDPFHVRQAAGLRAMTELAGAAPPGTLTTATEDQHEAQRVGASPRPLDNVRNYRICDDHPRSRHPALVPPPEGPAGTLTHEYPIPRVQFRPRRWLCFIPVSAMVAGSAFLHHMRIGSWTLPVTPWVTVVWFTTLAFSLTQVMLSWRQRPFTVTARQARQLSRLRVAVVIPCYNEDPAILDRTLFALSQQTRPADHVLVTDDGSTVSYDDVRTYWQTRMPSGLTWIRQDNAGKKHAQAAAFRADYDADIYVTIDSDSALAVTAIEEGLKPFARADVVSVAGLETAFNYRRNLLTLAMSTRNLVFQLLTMSAQSVAGSGVLINPGAFSLYRGWLIHQSLPAYLGETFLGIPVTLGDDTALSTFAVCNGRAVHQPTAVALNVYPENVSHHLRQWTRWMRASTIRTMWRLRYLPVLSWGWIFTVYSMWAFLTSVAITVLIPLGWPVTAHFLPVLLAASALWPILMSCRLITVTRSDQNWVLKLAGILLLPAASFWYLLVQRQIRFYGIATCYRQGWITRQKVEVGIGKQGGRAMPEVAT
jgi:hyaluronan synthase